MLSEHARKRKTADSACARPKPPQRRVRMAPRDREQMILEAAIDFFAKHGFSAQIRELARELKVSQGLIYRYFKSKDELLHRVYEHNFLRRWDAGWEALICDRAVPLSNRLKDFYSSYLNAIDDPVWIRLVMYSGLAGNDLTKRYISTHVERLLRAIARECRTLQAPDVARTCEEPDQAEMELVWHLHSTIIYYLIRKHILQTQTIKDVPNLVALVIDDFLSGLAGGTELERFARRLGPVGKISAGKKRNPPCP